jgi:S-adenosylmethionine synthetase
MAKADKHSFVFTSESVCQGHPDKVCDIISDTLLDEFLRHDKDAKVALETLVKANSVVVAGEVKSSHTVDYEPVIRQVIKELGYDRKNEVFNCHTCKISLLINEQSVEINSGVVKKNSNLQGAGDQGIMFGYASNEDVVTLMPVPIVLAHKITKELSKASIEQKWLRPDGKSQITIKYDEHGTPKEIDTVVVSVMHTKEKPLDEVKKFVKDLIILPILPDKMVTDKTKFFINPAGPFTIGGPECDTGLTGRKIIVDTYGGTARIGGGAFSGKDPSKVDRTGAYYARYVAKHIICSKLAEKCEIQVSYAIGREEPTSIHIEAFGTEKVSLDQLEKAVLETFDFKPHSMIKELGLLAPIYRETAFNGHFGNNDFPWEKISPEKIAKLNSCTNLELI